MLAVTPLLLQQPLHGPVHLIHRLLLLQVLLQLLVVILLLLTSVLLLVLLLLLLHVVTAVSVSDGAVQSNSCSRSQTRTFSASDGCGNSATASSTVTWTSDQTPPTFTGNYNDVTLGCNPPDINTSLGSASATDGCGTPTLAQSDGAVYKQWLSSCTGENIYCRGCLW
jgi:hypothetical protein